MPKTCHNGVLDILCDGAMIRTGMDNEGMFFNL